MDRRSFLLLGTFSPIALLMSRYCGAKGAKVTVPTDVTAIAKELNQLAASISKPSDARRLVDFVAELFSKEMPSGWKSGSLRHRIADAEFLAVSKPQGLIPEPRLAEAWNAYVEKIQAPEDQKATPAEIHYLRDSFLTAARLNWNGTYRNFWAVPSIYATLPDGRLAPGCRAIESIRLLWDLANMPDNLKSARDGVAKGTLFSDMFPNSQQSTFRATGGQIVARTASINPIEVAKRTYIEQHGSKAYRDAVLAMLRDTFA